MDPSRVTLQRQYAFVDSQEEKITEWGERLWKLLRANIKWDLPVVLKDRESYSFIGERLVNHLLARLVVRGLQIEEANKGMPLEIRIAKLAEAASDLLDVPTSVCDDIAFHLSKICPRILRRGGDLTSDQTRTIRGFARAHHHRCYICGWYLSYDATEPADTASESEVDWKRFQIDHIFPQARGGGRSRSNLAACCESCNKYKDVRLSYADILIEGAITKSVRENGLKSTFGGIFKFALLWRQGGSCALCQTPFYEAADERLFLIRRDARDVYHFFNAAITCGTCADSHQLHGVLLRA